MNYMRLNKPQKFETNPVKFETNPVNSKQTLKFEQKYEI